jgi:pSer/pThr/pTyr-binding forkhead associated (FHA) protein
MRNVKLSVMVMSGLEDGTICECSTEYGDGEYHENSWCVSIGREEYNDIIMRNDNFISRAHARLEYTDQQWWLVDCDSTNGTYRERQQNVLDEERLKPEKPVRIEIGQMFRVGHTWLIIQKVE